MCGYFLTTYIYVHVLYLRAPTQVLPLVLRNEDINCAFLYYLSNVKEMKSALKQSEHVESGTWQSLLIETAPLSKEAVRAKCKSARQ